MNFRWLKSILPKGLYGRAALIMIVPVITIQLVVSLVFIQRHFDGVTRQLTANVALELDYLLDRLNRANDPTGVIRDVATPLGYLVSPVAVMPTADALAFDDLTGANVIAVLHAQLSEMVRVDLKSLDRRVVLYATANGNPYRIEFDRSRVSASNPHQLLVLMIVTSLVMTLISFMFLRNQVRPIRRLAKAADAFGKGRRIAYHISGATEVRQAGHAFVRMRDRIERQIEQRTLMLSGVSHDLRTPLTRLKLGLSLAGRSDETEAMMQDVDEMQAMLEEFLAFARGDNLEETALSDPWSLAAQVAGNVGRTDGKVSLGDRPPSATPILVTMRPNAVRRALDNLVANALRYGKHCRLTVRCDTASVSFIVEDDGPGIPESQRENAIRPFVRLDTARNQNRGSGVGLGLAIASDVASSHGGALMLGESEDLGGLKATLRLPR
ncbi:MAG: HAMP domain-containing protein [Rhodobacteraceae bacterium]|nr:HAMP domain-containing protein [Paracoccaceae bacterium]